MYPQLTDREIATLLTLVRREARSDGYDSKWFMDNRPRWPRSLKRLHVIARKLQQIRENQSDQD